jgi:hypothetical protein
MPHIELGLSSLCCTALTLCDVLCCAGWLNRFASGAAATINITQDTVKTVRK